MTMQSRPLLQQLLLVVVLLLVSTSPHNSVLAKSSKKDAPAARTPEQKQALTKSLVHAGLSDKSADKVVSGKRLSRTERKQVQ
jgi:hypothetical protein